MLELCTVSCNAKGIWWKINHEHYNQAIVTVSCLDYHRPNCFLMTSTESPFLPSTYVLRLTVLNCTLPCFPSNKMKYMFLLDFCLPGDSPSVFAGEWDPEEGQMSSEAHFTVGLVFRRLSGRRQLVQTGPANQGVYWCRQQSDVKERKEPCSALVFIALQITGW